MEEGNKINSFENCEGGRGETKEETPPLQKGLTRTFFARRGKCPTPSWRDDYHQRQEKGTRWPPTSATFTSLLVKAQGLGLQVSHLPSRCFRHAWHSLHQILYVYSPRSAHVFLFVVANNNSNLCELILEKHLAASASSKCFQNHFR